MITVMLEVLLPKRRILEIYLNVIEWGSGVFGAEAASRAVFRRVRSAAFGGTGGAAGGDGAQSALLRAQSGSSGAQPEDRDHPGADARRGHSLTAPLARPALRFHSGQRLECTRPPAFGAARLCSIHIHVRDRRTESRRSHGSARTRAGRARRRHGAPAPPSAGRGPGPGAAGTRAGNRQAAAATWSRASSPGRTRRSSRASSTGCIRRTSRTSSRRCRSTSASISGTSFARRATARSCSRSPTRSANR